MQRENAPARTGPQRTGNPRGNPNLAPRRACPPGLTRGARARGAAVPAKRPPWRTDGAPRVKPGARLRTAAPAPGRAPRPAAPKSAPPARRMAATVPRARPPCAAPMRSLPRPAPCWHASAGADFPPDRTRCAGLPSQTQMRPGDGQHRGRQDPIQRETAHGRVCAVAGRRQAGREPPGKGLGPLAIDSRRCRRESWPRSQPAQAIAVAQGSEQSERDRNVKKQGLFWYSPARTLRNRLKIYLVRPTKKNAPGKTRGQVYREASRLGDAGTKGPLPATRTGTLAAEPP